MKAATDRQTAPRDPGNPGPEPGARPARRAERTRLPAPRSTLLLGPEATWFQVDGRPPISLRTHASLRRLLLALADMELSGSKELLSVNAAFEAGWPGERAKPTAAAARVYTAVHTLRTLGLRHIIVRRVTGYALEANVRLATDSAITELRPPPDGEAAPEAHAPAEEPVARTA